MRLAVLLGMDETTRPFHSYSQQV